jgi:hypothetical protein
MLNNYKVHVIWYKFSQISNMQMYEDRLQDGSLSKEEQSSLGIQCTQLN